MRPLIAIITCHKFKDRADAQRETWIPEMASLVSEDKRFDIKFFLGQGATRDPLPDEVFLDVPDDYKSLPYKVRAAFKWALDHGYDKVVKCDDDTFIFPERIVHDIPRAPYSGRLNKSMPHLAKKGWCSGFCYWVQGEALTMVANAPKITQSAEDLWVGQFLGENGIECFPHRGFLVLSLGGPREWMQHRNHVQAACEFPGEKMRMIHRALRSNDPKDMLPVPQKGTGYRVKGRPVKLAQFGRVIRKVK